MLFLSIKTSQTNFEKLSTASLLRICRKIFERLTCSKLYEYFIENELVSSKQSGYKPGDFCTNQELSITPGIYQSFENGFEVRGVLFGIFKAFDKV